MIQRVWVFFFIATIGCTRDDWSFRPLVENDVPDVSDVVDADVPDADVPDADVTPPPDVPLPSLRVLHGGIDPVGTLTTSTLRVSGTLLSTTRACTTDRSLCATGGISP